MSPANQVSNYTEGSIYHDKRQSGAIYKVNSLSVNQCPNEQNGYEISTMCGSLYQQIPIQSGASLFRL